MILFLVSVTAALLFLNFPIFIALLAGAVGTILTYEQVPMEIVVQTLFGSIDKFALMAVPFFILTAKLMDRGGLSRRLIAWVNSLLCMVRGAIAMTGVGSCMLFGAISGSSPATVVAIGSIIHPALLEQGYPRTFSLGLVTASGAVGIIIPPSIAMIIFATITNVSVGALFLAGIGAGLVFGLCFMGYVMICVRRYQVGEAVGFDLARFFECTKSAAWGLGAPIIILGGIYAGIFTPTEAAGVVTVYAIFVSMVVYREVNLRDLFEITVESAVLTGQMMVIVAASGIFAWLLTIGQAGPSVMSLVGGAIESPILMLLLLNVIFLVAGMFLDPSAAMVIIVPLLYPVILNLGIDPVHAGIIIVTNLAIGMFTPPFGFNLFVATSAFNATYREVVIGTLPFILAALLALTIVTWMPWVSLTIPQWAYGTAG